MDFFKKYPRSLATILVSVLTIVTGGMTNFDNGLEFFTDIFSGVGAPLALGFTLLLTWIGDRKFFDVELTPTMISIAGLIGIGLATFLGPAGVDLQLFLNEIVTNGEVWLGGITGVLIKLFGDRNISLNLDEQGLKE